MHPRLASRLGVADGDWVAVESRRGHCTLRVQVVTTIRPDTVFVPYHWGGTRSINRVTIAAQDPISKIPEFKVGRARPQGRRAVGGDIAPGLPGVKLTPASRGLSEEQNAGSRPVWILHRP